MPRTHKPREYMTRELELRGKLRHNWYKIDSAVPGFIDSISGGECLRKTSETVNVEDIPFFCLGLYPSRVAFESLTLYLRFEGYEGENKK
ncbi:glutamate synthase [Moniliophthora roreri]|nr:glutamate synthase [Moniliophthora roreri]